MSISWAIFRHGPLGSRRLQKLTTPTDACKNPRLCRFDETGGEHHEHQLFCLPCLCRFDEAGGEHHEHQLCYFPC